MEQKTSNKQQDGNDLLAVVMPRLSIKQIESITVQVVGEMYPKRLKHLPNLHPQANANGLIMIGIDYFKWEYVNGA